MAKRLALLACIATFLTFSKANAVQESGRQLVCGPRCVQSVLEQYGIKEDLIALIEEMQDGDVLRGCSLLEIKNALEERGLFTKVVKCGTFVLPKWEEPVVLHYGSGHFVVFEGQDGLSSKIRDGIGMKIHLESTFSVLSKSSGGVLFTSSTEIEELDFSWRWRGIVVAVLFSIGGSVFISRQRFVVNKNTKS